MQFSDLLIYSKNNKSIIPTEKGIFLIEKLPVEELKNPEMTGQWEKRLHDITTGNENYNKFITEIENTVREWYAAIVSSSGEFAEKQLYCPFCNSKIIKGQYGYFCSSRKETGCNFSVNFEICGKKISNSQIFKLIEQGKTSLIKGFKKKDGSKEFDAYLVVDKNQKKIKFEFP